MTETLIIAILLILLFAFAIWRFPNFRGTLTLLGAKAKIEGSRTPEKAKDAAQGSRKTVPGPTKAHAEGDGAVAVVGSVQNAKIETNVKKTFHDNNGPEPTPGSADVRAKGDGAVAVGGSAKGASIKTNVNKTARDDDA